MVLYANNYQENDHGLMLFDDLNSALETFKKGKRKAKGTTAEVGLVESYFANPFGPVQQNEITDEIINTLFEKMFNDRISVGELFTELAIDGKEKSGPQTASMKLLEYLINK